MNKKERQTAAVQKANRKKMIMASVFVLVFVCIVALTIFNAVQQSTTCVYTDGHQTVTLRKNGNFSAALAHETREGIYTENGTGDIIVIVFVSDGKSVEGIIEKDVLNLPDEWQDDHGHGSKLKLSR